MIGGEGIQSKSDMKQDLKVLGSKVGSQNVQSGQGMPGEAGQFGQTSGTGRASATTGSNLNGQTGSNGGNTGTGTKGRHDGSSNSSNIMTHNPVNATIHTDESFKWLKPVK